MSGFATIGRRRTAIGAVFAPSALQFYQAVASAGSQS
jgi:hypothetical protein